MSKRNNLVVTGPLNSFLFKLFYIYLEPIVCFGYGYYAITHPADFITGLLDVTSNDAVAIFLSRVVGMMLIITGLLIYFGLKYSTVRGRFWITVSLLIGDLLSIFGSLQVMHQFPGKPVCMGYNITVVTSVALAVSRSLFMLLAIWYEGNNLDKIKTH